MMDYYEILGVSYTATDDEIHKAYLKMAKKYHPDLNRSSDEYVEKMKNINIAYKTLSDKVKRSTYDLKIKKQKEKKTQNDSKFEQNKKETKQENNKESLWEYAKTYYSECDVEKDSEAEENLNYKFPFYFSLLFIWIIAFVWQPYTVIVALMLCIARYAEMKKSNKKQRKYTGISISILLIWLAVLHMYHRL